MEKDVTEKEVEMLGRTVSHEINLMYILSLACDAMIFDIERRMRKVDAALHLKNEAKMRMKQYLGLLSNCETQYEHFISPTIIGNAEKSAPDFSSYERSREFAQEIIRFIMMYYEKCSPIENHNKVFELLMDLDGGRGVFSAEDINTFNLGCK